MFFWLVGCLIDWLVGWLIGWLVGWLVDDWLVGWFYVFGRFRFVSIGLVGRSVARVDHCVNPGPNCTCVSETKLLHSCLTLIFVLV